MRIDVVEQHAASASDGARIIESCVHCGLCTATCPTYELMDNELDSPRGRIYLIKEMLEGAPVSGRTRQHLDRCLGCRACETACPSGVQYGHLLDLGRQALEKQVPRPRAQRWFRLLLRRGLSSTAGVRMAMSVVWTLSPLLPRAIRSRVPPKPRKLVRPAPRHARRVLTMGGCVQPVFAPEHDAAVAALLDRSGVSLVTAPSSACCGALAQNLDGHEQAIAAMRRNIDAWWPLMQQGVEAIISGSSGCGAMLKDYGTLLKHAPAYADKAKLVSSLVKDPAELIAALWHESGSTLRELDPADRIIAYQAPCSQQNVLRSTGAVEALLRQAGYTLTPVADAHMCCAALREPIQSCRRPFRRACGRESCRAWRPARRLRSCRPTSAASCICAAALVPNTNREPASWRATPGSGLEQDG